MKERPILVAVIGYMIGILWGLYFKFSIVFCYILILATYYIKKNFFKIHKEHKFKLLSINRYIRYLKLVLDKKSIIILILLSIISNVIILKKNDQYENAYEEGKEIKIMCIVTGKKKEKQYYDLYQVKILDSKKLNLYIQVNKNSEELEYGDKIRLQGTYSNPSEKRNYGGYDDKQYLKTLKIVGRVKVKKIEIIEKKQENYILQLANELKGNIEEKIEKNFEKEKASILKGLLLGETEEIQEEMKEDFQISNISHILAISGMHIGYIALGIQLSLKKILGKKKANIITIFILIFYSFITGFSPSVVRAVVMGIITIGTQIVYRQSDTWNSIAFSLLIILIYNPFLILNIGLQLSYLGAIGIVLFFSSLFKIINKIPIFNKMKEMIAVSLSAQITILPILIYHFNIIGIYFLVTNLLVGLVIGPIIILAFFSIYINIFVIPLNIGLEFLNIISKFSRLPFSKIYLKTPSIISIILYFIALWIGHQIYNIYSAEILTSTQKRVKNLIALFKYKFKQKRKRYVKGFLIFLVIMVVICFIPKDLKIYFVDVGQGDCTFIVTPKSKTILIDGGGSLSDEFDVGKKTLIPYLLDRGYTTIDYIMISHFDQDHVGRITKCYTGAKCKKCYYFKAGREFSSISEIHECGEEEKN